MTVNWPGVTLQVRDDDDVLEPYRVFRHRPSGPVAAPGGLDVLPATQRTRRAYLQKY
jgi:hypothetical protein